MQTIIENNILDSQIKEPTIGNGTKIELGNCYWYTLDIFLHGKEYMFCLKGKFGADKITFYKSFKVGINNTKKFIQQFK